MPDLSRPLPAPAVTTEAMSQVVHDIVVSWLQSEAGLNVDEIDPDASLFELGVDSLGAATIGHELELVTKKRIEPEIVYEMETINQLVEYLESLPEPSVLPHQPPTVPSPSELPPAALDDGLSMDAAADPIQHYELLNRRVRGLKKQGMYFFETVISEHDGAWVVADGRRMLMLSSYEYLGLLGHRHLQVAISEALEQFGTGHHGARLLVGTTSVHKRLESMLAQFMNAQDALVFNSGYVANLATIAALVGPGDLIIGDQFNHASIMDGCRMSGAEVKEFRHNDPESLEQLLRQSAGRRTLVVVDAVFSMDGDIAKLPEIVSLCKRYRALLMVDEAHSLGVLGAGGRGIQEHFDLPHDAIDIKMGTLSKALASSGGFVAGREELITYLRHHARGYIFSGALPACQAAAAVAALEVINDEPHLVRRLKENTDAFLAGLQELGFDTASSETPIVPIMAKTDQIALHLTSLCRDRGLLVVPVCYPAVPMDAPRLRTCISAIHSSEDIQFALDVLEEAGRLANLIS
ncbi:MAG: aminotransferase class I/II-fold pyridoxal phosphate-dependent enzyme [Pirellulales bacterium]